MPLWKPEPLWDGADAIIIGGGPSLKDFPWDVLKQELTIGCNAAYTLGKEVCSIVLFGDSTFLNEHESGLEKYGGPVFTNARKLMGSDIPWLYTIPRRPKGLSKCELCWNGNTGAVAINLALILGAKRVYLLGFDMHTAVSANETVKRKNWHDLYIEVERRKKGSKKKDKANPYPRFLEGFDAVVEDQKKLFPDRKIINVNDDTALRCFPVMAVSDFLKERADGKNNVNSC